MYLIISWQYSSLYSVILWMGMIYDISVSILYLHLNADTASFWSIPICLFVEIISRIRRKLFHHITQYSQTFTATRPTNWPLNYDEISISSFKRGGADFNIKIRKILKWRELNREITNLRLLKLKFYTKKKFWTEKHKINDEGNYIINTMR